MKNNIKVDIIVKSYNIVDYIQQCLNGIITQQTNFSFRTIIYDDGSTDGTANIIKNYTNLYPNIFTAYCNKENIYTKGKTCWDYTYKLADAKYIATCDGDDFWVDKYKLQKQVDFLDNNSEYSMCFHNAYIFDLINKTKSKFNYDEQKEIISIYDLAKKNVINHSTKLFRNGLLKEPMFLKNCIDYYDNLVIAQHGFVKFMPELMSVSFQRPDGIWSGKSEKEHYKIMIDFLEKIMPLFNAYVRIILLQQQIKFKYEYNKC